MSKRPKKCQNNPNVLQIYSLKLFIAFKIAYSCWFSLGVNLDFLYFLQKKFYNIDFWLENALTSEWSFWYWGIDISAFVAASAAGASKSLENAC